MMKKSIVAAVAAAVVINGGVSQAAEYYSYSNWPAYFADRALPTIGRYGDEATPEYWCAKLTDDKILMTAKQIELMNDRGINDERHLYDMANFPETKTAVSVLRAMYSVSSKYKKPGFVDNAEGYYYGGRPIKKEFFQEALDNCDWKAKNGSENRVDTQYAVTVKRASLRALPTDNQLTSDGSEMQTHYDELQLTVLDPAEPVAVMWSSADGGYSFVYSRNYVGWIKESAIAYTNREQWMKYAGAKAWDCAVVTENKLRITEGDISQVYQMGARIPLTENGELMLPVCDINGELSIVNVRLEENDYIRKGPLPLTRSNIIRQAFRFLGDEYGWGGQDESVDCSAFVSDVYRSMGVDLPRDVYTQSEHAWRNMKAVSLDRLSHQERMETLKNIPLGALMYNKQRTHVCMWLGFNEDNNPIVIHSTSSFYLDGQKYYPRQVMVSDITYPAYDGSPMLDNISLVGQL